VISKADIGEILKEVAMLFFTAFPNNIYGWTKEIQTLEFCEQTLDFVAVLSVVP
jgi:hypothetical protein